LLVGVPFDLTGARQHYGDEARWASVEAEARLDVARNDAAALARDAWVDVAVSDAAIALASARLATADALLSAVRARLDAQSATALDLALAERERAGAEFDLVTARRERDAAAARLREALSLSPLNEVEVASIGAPTVPVGWTRERAVALAAQHRRESSAFAAAARRLSASRQRLHHEATAPLFVAGEVEWQGYSQASFGFSAQWALPLSQTNQGDRALADAQSRTQDEQRALALRGAGHDGATAFTELERRLEELSVLEERAIPAAERALSLTEALFRAGSIDAFRLLLARQQLFADRARRLDALRAAWHARVALDRATGQGDRA
jgi:outer membrane protein TolC